MSVFLCDGEDIRMNDEKKITLHEIETEIYCSSTITPKFLSDYKLIKNWSLIMNDELSQVIKDKKFEANAVKNCIINGDSYKVIKTLADNSIDCIYTDIPYLLNMGSSGYSDVSDAIMSVKEELVNISDGIDFCILEDFVRVLKKINCFIWCSRSQINDIVNFFSTKNCTVEYLFWGKTNPIPTGNNTWLSDVEHCLHIREKGVKLNDGYHLKSKFFISLSNKSDKAKYKHPTIKPKELVKRHILHATQKGDLVADFFGGVMTTCIACIETNRNYLGVEINKKWCDIGENRLNGIDTGGQTSLLLQDVEEAGGGALDEFER